MGVFDCGPLPSFVTICAELVAMWSLGRNSYQAEARMAEKRIGLRQVRALAPAETVWDAAVPGFGARRQSGNAVAYVLKFRTAEGRQRWHTIGRHGAPWTPETARGEAKRLLGSVADG